MPAEGTFTRYPSLVEPLPPLVRRQRRLAATIATVAEAVTDEKACRGQIDQLLILAGLQKSDVVTCLGYDIRHNEKAGSSRINGDTLFTLLVSAGVDSELVTSSIETATEIGNPALFCTVTPTKGAKVSQTRIPGPHRQAMGRRERQRA